jgi:serine/threonine-protein kinase RsbT
VTPLITKSETIPIKADEDVGRVRQAVRQYAVDLQFSIVEQTKIVTAASELARNVIVHGGGEGSAHLEVLQEGIRKGLRVCFADNGPGIPDIQRALQDGFTTGGGLGLGLGGAKRLVNDFQIESSPGNGARITITRWK